MSNGIIFRNSSNSAVISDYTSSLYFMGKATLIKTAVGAKVDSAKITAGTTYTFNLGSHPAYPMAYVSCPTGKCAVLRVFYAAPNYRVEVLAKGNATVPEVYVFGVKGAYTGPEKYGMKVVKPSGEVAYDSRNGKILNLKDIKEATFLANNGTLPVAFAVYTDYSEYPSYRTYSIRYGLDITSNNYVPIKACVKPAISINTLAICNRFTNWNTRQVNYELDPFTGQYYVVYRQNVSYRDSAVYRGGFALVSGTIVNLCWVPHAVTQNYTYSTSMPGGDMWGTPGGYEDSGGGGTLPYANASINLTGGAMSVIDGAEYD